MTQAKLSTMKLDGEPTVAATSSPQNYQFDFDLGPGFSKAQPTASLKEQKQKASTAAAAAGGSEPPQGSGSPAKDALFADLLGDAFGSSSKKQPSNAQDKGSPTSTLLEIGKDSPAGKQNTPLVCTPAPEDDLDFLLDSNVFKNTGQRPTSAGSEPFLMGAKVGPIGDIFADDSPASKPSGAVEQFLAPVFSGDPNLAGSKCSTISDASSVAKPSPSQSSKPYGPDSSEEFYGLQEEEKSAAVLEISVETEGETSPPNSPISFDGKGIMDAGLYEGLTTELEGLNPPPGGLTAEVASKKGKALYKEGQYPNAIMWLSWGEELIGKDKNDALLVQIITCRLACFKQIGEYKKALMDCTKALKMNERDINLLMQRAHLYESMEKYKQGVADLKLVLKIDPEHRMAILELVRLTDLAGLRKVPFALRSLPNIIEMIRNMGCLLTPESKCVKLNCSCGAMWEKMIGGA